MKFIIPYIVELDWNKTRLKTRYNSYTEHLEDLVKVLCFLTGTNYDKTTYFNDFFNRMHIQPNVWYSWGFFEIKGFKKGTLHIKFQNEEDWALLNRAYGKIKGAVLPEILKPNKTKQSGYHLVNRFGYLITEKPYESIDDFVKIECDIVMR